MKHLMIMTAEQVFAKDFNCEEYDTITHIGEVYEEDFYEDEGAWNRNNRLGRLKKLMADDPKIRALDYHVKNRHGISVPSHYIVEKK